MSAHRLDVYNVEAGGDLVDQNEGTNSTECLLKFRFQNDKIISANGGKLHKIGVLSEVIRILFIVRHKLLCVSMSGNEMLLDKLNDALSVGVGLVMEVETIGGLLNVNRLLVGIMTQNQLFQEQESSLMSNSLTDLHLTRPLMGSPSLLTVVTLMVLDHEFNTKCLLQEGSHLHLLLHGKFEFDSSAMSLSVNELGVQKFNTL